MKHYFSTLTFLIFIFVTTGIQAEIKLPAIFGDNMVLQQQTEAAIWGKSEKNKTVKVTTSWNKKNYSTKADNEGNWKVKVQTPNAGGPYSITISDGKSLTLKNVLIGEVWVCSGQSNMQMTMSGYFNQPVTGANQAIATSRNEKIRLFTVKHEKSLEQQYNFSGDWQECLPENVAQFSAAAYFFGEMINETLGVPVGLICSSWGGTRIEPWISENGFGNFDWVNLPDKNSKEEFNQQVPTVLYNAMIAPMVGYSIRGGLWYQGEANRNQPKEYEKLMSGLIDNWRNEWGIGDFSFYYVQIAPFNYGPNSLNSAFLREAQFKASTAIQNIGMACAMDVGEEFCIHPANKKVVGERLAYLALANTYGMKGVEYSGPVLKEMTVEGSLVKLTFDHAKNGLTTFGKELKNFKVAGEDKRFVPATAHITRKGITLSSPLVEKPVAVRYAFDDFVIGELFNTEGLPASSFRTDDWEMK
ncbi:sialate O-acetylesterase [Mariniphaga anaerophila]|uniref:Sialate O-acetylesterase n=1 Tax=Mariniphaga anaerophila TaxID=1484053 RepID=A0A1M5EW83_9BACT|nr:sialate O-acetylesterase [Mariniphaga anaerophila]SHF83500.1 sialate O-acetylesterase [Mariniphaga anaerophila]